MYNSFIQGKHEHDPRRIYSTTGTDWQERVNFERMRKDRLAKVREQMDAHNLGAMILFVGENVRYVTGVWQGNWKNNIFIRYAVLPRNGEPVLFETVGSDMVCAAMDAPWLKEENVRPAITWRWAESAEKMQVEKMAKSVYQVLAEHHVEKEQVGIDVMDMLAYQAFTELGINLVNAWPAMKDARVIKTPDEIESLKIAAAHGDAAMWMAMNEWAKPGVTEREVSAKVNEYLYRKGFDVVYDIIVASGGNTSPYRRWATDKLMRVGDLVIIDINAVGPGGYFIDFVRCFKVGGVKPTQQEKDLYKETYDSLYRAIDKMKPGNTTADVAKEFPVYDDDKYRTVSLQQFAHSIGLTLYEGMWISRAYSLEHPAEIKPNMYFAVETFAGHPGLHQTVRLEENVVITDTGNAVTTLAPHPEEFFQ